jgi:hypothetical protein
MYEQNARAIIQIDINVQETNTLFRRNCVTTLFYNVQMVTFVSDCVNVQSDVSVSQTLEH